MDYQELLLRAKEARLLAYAPYSNFAVGAALLTSTGEVFTGCNIENASYGLTICAERVAVAKAVSTGFNEFQGIAIYAGGEDPVTPCGACRQVLLEFGGETDVVMGNAQGVQLIMKVKELLPEAFALGSD
ncbi:MAG: cytidine deaminase [Bacillota bacterium]